MGEGVTLTGDMPILRNSGIDLRVRRGERVVVVPKLPRTMFVDAHERQCQANHSGQTLERIRERHGLSAIEAVAVLACLPFEAVQALTHETAHRILYAMHSTHNRGMRIAEAALTPSTEEKRG
jgi:hypothetical protein